MQQSELKPKLMITNITGRQQFYRVSTLKEQGFTAVVEWPILLGSTVRTFAYDELDHFRPLTDAELNNYCRVRDEATKRAK
jgi:hypothetical protein